MSEISDAEREQRIAQFHRDQAAIIDEYGWSVIGVFPTADDPGVQFAYTVGLTVHGFPEFMIFGLSASTGQSLLNDMGRRVFDRNERFVHGQRINDLIFGFDAVVVDGEPLDGMPPGQAYAMYGRSRVKVQQIVWPDQGGRYPWDDGWSLDVDVQPTIGVSR